MMTNLKSYCSKWLVPMLIIGTLSMTGCSNIRTIENNVLSYSSLQNMPSPATYSIEQLPSQQSNHFERVLLEHLATKALADVGMQRDDSNGAYKLELLSSKNSYYSNWPTFHNDFRFSFLSSPWEWHPYFDYTNRWRDFPLALYVYNVRLVLRDRNGKAVYETTARYDDIWNNDEAIFNSLLQAALNGFPTPPEGLRRIKSPYVLQ